MIIKDGAASPPSQCDQTRTTVQAPSSSFDIRSYALQLLLTTEIFANRQSPSRGMFVSGLRILTATAVAIAVAMSSAVAATASTPGTATPNPELYAFGYSDDFLYSVDATTGVGTRKPSPIGMGVGGTILGASFNPEDGVLYTINSSPNSCRLWAVDLQTGAGRDTGISPIGNLPDGNPTFDCSSMAFSPDGVLYLGLRTTASPRNTYLAVVDLRTGAIGTAVTSPNNSIMNFIAVSPSDGRFYVQTSTGNDDMFTWNPLTGVFTLSASGGNQTMYGAAFLPDGTILANSWPNLVEVNLSTLGAWRVIGRISSGDIGALVNAANYWPAPVVTPSPAPVVTPSPAPVANTNAAPQLAATGVDASPLFALGGLAFALVAAGAIALRRRTV
jgi:LPXTG-motif cell wall-anchored protein